MSMDADQLEALDLFCRHDIDLGLVLGLDADAARALVDQARQELERALGAEILASRGSHACPDRAEVMAGWTGVMTPAIRDRVLQHAADCPVCGPKQPRNVSAVRVFALLPSPPLPSGARDEVLDFAENESHAAYREFAVSRTAALAAAGFPAVEATAIDHVLPEPAAAKPEPQGVKPEPAAAGHVTPERAAAERVTPEPEAAEPAGLEPTAPAHAAELLAVPELSTPAERLAAAAALLAAVDLQLTPTAEPQSAAPEPAGPASTTKDPAGPASTAKDPAGPASTAKDPAGPGAPTPKLAVPAQPPGPTLETLPRQAAAAPVPTSPVATTPSPTAPSATTPASPKARQQPQPRSQHPGQPRQLQDHKPQEIRKPQETRRPQGPPPPPPAPGAKPRRRSTRTGLLVGLAGAMASAAIVGSTLALNSPVTSAAQDVNHTIATGSPASAVIAQPTSLGSGGAVTIVPSQASGGQTPALKPLSRVQPASPPLMSTPGTRAETMITLATQPSGHASAPHPGAAPAKSATAKTSAVTLHVPSSLAIGGGSSGQITITAVGGSVHWSATAASPLISLSQSSGTVAPGQPATLTVTVDRGSDAGSADVSIALPNSAPQTISVIWSAQPVSAGRESDQGTGPGLGQNSGSGPDSGSGGSTGTGSGRSGHSGAGASRTSGTSGTSGSPGHRRSQGAASTSAPASGTSGS